MVLIIQQALAQFLYKFFACMLSEAILLFISTSLAVYQQWQPQTDIDTGWWQHTPFSKVIRFYSNVTRPVSTAPSGTHPAQFFLVLY